MVSTDRERVATTAALAGNDITVRRLENRWAVADPSWAAHRINRTANRKTRVSQ